MRSLAVEIVTLSFARLWPDWTDGSRWAEETL